MIKKYSLLVVFQLSFVIPAISGEADVTNLDVYHHSYINEYESPKFIEFRVFGLYMIPDVKNLVDSVNDFIDQVDSSVGKDANSIQSLIDKINATLLNEDNNLDIYAFGGVDLSELYWGDLFGGNHGIIFDFVPYKVAARLFVNLNGPAFLTTNLPDGPCKSLFEGTVVQTFDQLDALENTQGFLNCTSDIAQNPQTYANSLGASCNLVTGANCNNQIYDISSNSSLLVTTASLSRIRLGYSYTLSDSANTSWKIGGNFVYEFGELSSTFLGLDDKNSNVDSLETVLGSLEGGESVSLLNMDLFGVVHSEHFDVMITAHNLLSPSRSYKSGFDTTFKPYVSVYASAFFNRDYLVLNWREDFLENSSTLGFNMASRNISIQTNSIDSAVSARLGLLYMKELDINNIYFGLTLFNVFNIDLITSNETVEEEITLNRSIGLNLSYIYNF